MEATFKKAFEKGTRQYGFVKKELPLLAEYATYTAMAEEQADQMIKLVSPAGKILCLGMDATIMSVLEEDKQAACARAKARARVKRICYIQPVYSREDSVTELTSEMGVRSKYQWGMEILGEEAGTADAEVIAAAFAILESAGIPKEDLRLELGDARVCKWLLDQKNFGGKYRHRVQQWLEEKNIAALHSEGLGVFAGLAGAFGGFEEAMEQMGTALENDQLEIPKSLTSIRSLERQLKKYGIADVQGDFGATNRYHYYSSYMYRIYAADSGKLIATGGRYDNLDGKGLKGCGISFDDENIMEVLEMNNYKKKSLWVACEADYTVLWTGKDDREGIELAQSLRSMGYSVVVSGAQADSLAQSAESDQAQISKYPNSRCLVWVNSGRVRVVDQLKNQTYQSDLEVFKKSEEGRRYVGSIH